MRHSGGPSRHCTTPELGGDGGDHETYSKSFSKSCVPSLPQTARRPSSSQGWKRGVCAPGAGRRLSLKECLISSGLTGANKHGGSKTDQCSDLFLTAREAGSDAQGDANEPSWLQLPVHKVQAASEVVTEQLKGGPFGLSPDGCQNCAARLKVWATAIDRIVDKYRLTDLLSLESDLKQARIENRVLEKAFVRIKEEMVAYKSVAEGVWANESDSKDYARKLEERDHWLSKQLEEEKDKTSRLIVKLFDTEQHIGDLQREIHQLQKQLELLAKRTRSKDSPEGHLSLSKSVAEDPEMLSDVPPMDGSYMASEGLYHPSSDSKERSREEITASAVCQWIDRHSSDIIIKVSQLDFDGARKLQEDIDIIALKAKYAAATSNEVFKRSETSQSSPSMWAITVKQLTDFRDDIESDLTSYSSEHDVLRRPDGQIRHVCLQRPCRCDHAEAVYVAKASVAKADQNKLSRLKADMQLVAKRYLAGAPEGFALSKNPGGLLAEIFVVHCWNATFLKFVAALEKVLHPDAKLWISAFALPPDVREQTLPAGAEGAQAVFSSPAFAALYTIQTSVVVLDDQLLLPMRAWCSLEIVFAMATPGHKVIPLISDHLDIKLCQARMGKQDMRNMRISSPKDLPALLEACTQQVGSIDRCHDLLREFWTGAMRGYEQILQHKSDVVTRLEELEDASADSPEVKRELSEQRTLFLEYLAAAQQDTLSGFSGTSVLGRPLAERRTSFDADAEQQLERALNRLPDPSLALLVRECMQRRLEQAGHAHSHSAGSRLPSR